VTTTPGQTAQRRGTSATEQFKEIEDIGVPTSSELIDFLNTPDVRGALSPQARKVVAKSAQQLADGKPVTRGLRLRDIEDLRQGLAKRVGPGADFRFADLRDTVRSIGEEIDPKFGSILREFGKRSDIERGLKAGRGALAGGKTSEFVGEFGRANPATQAGTRVGARTALTDVAAESPQGARRVAERLAEDQGLSKRLQTVLPDAEAARLQQLGQAETTAARGFERLAGGTVPTKVGQRVENIKEGIQSGVFSAVGAGGAAKASLATTFIKRLQISPRAARQLAEDAVDPNKVEAVIARLRALKIQDEAITKIFEDAAQAAGITAGVAVGDQQQ
jgi:hypothetical protein